jgi:hypothetical protein
MMRGVFFAAVLLLSAASFGAERGDPAMGLQRGIQLYREASYAGSVAALEQARARGGLSSEQSIECAFWLGAGYVALGSTAAARRELKRVLQAAPKYELPEYTSPKVAALFHDVADELERAPRLRPLPPERRPHGGFFVRFEASRTGGRAFGVVAWRWRGERDYHEVALWPSGDVYEAALPIAADGRAGTIEYFAVGQAPSGAIAAGAADKPLELPVARELAASLQKENQTQKR